MVMGSAQSAISKLDLLVWIVLVLHFAATDANNMSCKSGIPLNAT
jgi:hypothetical protein